MTKNVPFVKIAITENEERMRKQLRSYLERLAGEQNIAFEIREFSNGKELLDNISAGPDIIFLDINMPEMDGMSAAEKIREKDSRVILIFITELAQYALQGYRVQAFDYVLKPVSYYAFLFSVRRALRTVLNRPEAPNIQDKNIILSYGGNVTPIPVAEITYFEVTGHKVFCHTLDQVYPTTTHTLTSLEESLSSSHFVRCNNCYLVNLAKVKTVDKTSCLVGHDRLAISRPRKKAFLTALTDYLENL